MIDWVLNTTLMVFLTQMKTEKYVIHYVKSVRIRGYTCPQVRSISLFSVRMRENADQNNFEYGHFSRSDF